MRHLEKNPILMRKIAKISLWIGFLLFLLLVAFIILYVVLLVNLTESESCDVDLSASNYMANHNIADIVVTMTTMPNRLQSQMLKKVMTSLFKQEVRPKEIRINVPYVSKRTRKEYIIPEWMTSIPITIHRCEDMGPATKYLSTVRDLLDLQLPKQRILVVDDDMIPPNDLVKQMDLLSTKYPDYCITTSSYRFKDVGKEALERFAFVSKSTLARQVFGILFEGGLVKEMPQKDEVTFTDMVLGYVGYTLTPEMVQWDDISNFEKLPSDAFYVDDVVMSASLLKNGTKIVVGKNLLQSKTTLLNHLYYTWASIFPSANESLILGQNASQSHDHIMELYFKQHWQFLHDDMF